MASKRRDSTLYFVDIFLAAYLIGRYSENFRNGDELLHDRLHWDGVIREFEIIGEATNKLLKSGGLKEKDVFRQIVDFRNRIIHEYFGIDEEIVYDVIKNALPDFIDELKNILKTQTFDLTTAIEATISENERDVQIVRFLENLKHEFENV